MRPAESRVTWELHAERWIAQADRIAEMTRPATQALLAALDPRPGQVVLDVASGVGDPALEIARRVGARGRVLATDAVPAMVAALAARAAARRLPWIDARHLAAEALEEHAGCDAACSRFGVMFFDDPPRALRNMRRAVREGGPLLAMAWGPRAGNPYFTLVSDALDACGAPLSEADRAAPSVFECAAPGALLDLTVAAGWREARVEPVPFELVLADTTPDTLLAAQAVLSRKVEERLETLDAAGRARARDLVARAATPFARPDGSVRFPAEALLARARA